MTRSYDNIQWLYQSLLPKSGMVWGWLAVEGQCLEYEGEVTIRDGNIALDLKWTIQRDMYDCKTQEIPRMRKALSAGDFPQVSTAEGMDALLLGMDFKKAVRNSLVYSKVADDISKR